MSDDTTTQPVSEHTPAPEPAPALAPPVAPARPRRSGVWWGMALVLIGLALLVSQFAPAIELWRFWPLIVVAFGIRAMFTPGDGRWSIRHLFEGLSTVALGLVFLGQMLGYLSWDVWLNILRLWPLLIISLGLELVGKGLRSEWVRALGSIVVIGGLAYGALVMSPTAGWSFSPISVGVTEPFSRSAAGEPDVAEGTAHIEGGVGSLTVQAGADLASADGRSPFEPLFEVESDGRTADVRVGLGEHSWGPLTSDAELDVTLSEDVLWDLEVMAGVSRYDLDLRDLAVSRLRLEAGVSDGVLVLGESAAAGVDGAIPVEVEAGVSALRIRVPEGDRVRADVTRGLSGLTVRGDWDRIDDGDERTIYESERFDDNEAYWDIRVESGIGGITIEYY